MKTFTILSAALLSLAMLASPTAAASSTNTGQISVAQVNDLLARAGKDNAVRNALMAYLAGVGETAGLLLGEANALGKSSVACAQPLSMSDVAAKSALAAAAPDSKRWTELAATPILVADMLQRAACK